MAIDFPDLPYLKRVTKRLWEGRAAAFVGAGMSRTAVRRAPSAPAFPLWTGLAKTISKQLYGEAYAHERPDPLRLAQEYETAFGREALNGLIAEAVPDSEYDPGPLHIKLLNLPWADILTTNYDTLLEKARRKAERKYEVVRHPEDLSRRRAPRIVKLHGSLPSDYPLIITEEDYRTYPQRFAPFVSLARTSLMEHAFVLIGFSGEDPNFLRWSGWIRDNLEESAPPIYLCGALDLSAPRRKQLESYGVRPIDLAPLFRDWPDPDRRHEAALRWFLEVLRCGEPGDPVEWPDYRPARRREPDMPDSYPLVPSSPLPPPAPSQRKRGPHKAGESSHRNPEEILEPWQEARKVYPGWVIAPRAIRNRIWRGTQSWGRAIVESVEDVDAPDDLALLYELAWRRRLCLLPLYVSEIQEADQVLKIYNPAPHKLNLPAVAVAPDEAEYDRFDWSYLAQAWVELNLFLLREARVGLDEEAFNERSERVRPLAKEQDEWIAHLSYETALLHLARLDEEQVRQALDDWPSTMEGFPFGEVRRAAVWLEIGDNSKAARLAARALSRILEAQSVTAEPHFALSSQEGWTRQLLRMARNEEENTLLEPPYWKKKLRPYHCNPFEMLRDVSVRLEKEVPSPKSASQVKRKFDPGIRSRSFSLFSARYTLAEHRPGFECIQMLEAGAWPLWSGYGIKPLEAAQDAAEWIHPFEPVEALSIAFRAGSEQVAAFFSRMRVASLSSEQVDFLYEWLLRGIRQRAERLNSHVLRGVRHPEAQRMSALLEALSRLSIRVSATRRGDLAELGLRMCREPAVQGDPNFYEALGNLLRRTLHHLDEEQTRKHLESVLSFPTPSGDPALVQKWPAPILAIRDVELEGGFSTEHAAAIEELCEAVVYGDVRKRDDGIRRLNYLRKHGGLQPSQEESFAEAIWEVLDEETGLPRMWHMMDAYLLYLPEVEKGQAERRLRDVLLGEIPRAASKTEADGKAQRAITGGNFSGQRIKNIIIATAPQFDSKRDSGRRYIEWTDEEIKKLLGEVRSFWHHDGQALREERERRQSAPHVWGGHTTSRGPEEIPTLMQKVILPALSPISPLVAEAKNILDEMNNDDFSIVESCPSLLRLEAIETEEARRLIQSSLNATSRQAVEKAVESVCDWHLMSASERAPAPPEDLLNEVVYVVSARRKPGLAQTLSLLGQLVNEVPDVLSRNQSRRIIGGLDRLADETAPLDPERAWERPRLSEESMDAPERRAASARLAYALDKNLREERLDATASETLSKWKRICESDPLPEVRQAWEER